MLERKNRQHLSLGVRGNATWEASLGELVIRILPRHPDFQVHFVSDCIRILDHELYTHYELGRFHSIAGRHSQEGEGREGAEEQSEVSACPPCK